MKAIRAWTKRENKLVKNEKQKQYYLYGLLNNFHISNYIYLL